MPRIMHDAWLKYSHRVLDPIRADQVQRQETRRAFYAGASALLHAITENLTPEEDPQPQDLLMMDSITRELDEFLASVRAGRA